MDNELRYIIVGNVLMLLGLLVAPMLWSIAPLAALILAFAGGWGISMLYNALVTIRWPEVKEDWRDFVKPLIEESRK